MSLVLTEKLRVSSLIRPRISSLGKFNDRIRKDLSPDPILSKRIHFTQLSSLGLEALSILLLYISLRHRALTEVYQRFRGPCYLCHQWW